MQKLKLKEDEEGNKISTVAGIRSKIKCMKTRYNQPFTETTLHIPYETGLNPYSGLIDLFEQSGILVKDGNKLKYTYLDGTENKWFRKQLIKDTNVLDDIMGEFKDHLLIREKEKNKSQDQDNETGDLKE